MSRVSHDIEITYKRAWSREPSLPIFGIFCAVIALPLRVGISIQYSTRHMETLQLTCRLWMVSIMLYLVQGYPTGAPEEACSTFVPLHKGNKAQDGDGGYKLTLDTDEGFTPGRFHTGKIDNLPTLLDCMAVGCVHSAVTFMLVTSLVQRSSCSSDSLGKSLV